MVPQHVLSQQTIDELIASARAAQARAYAPYSHYPVGAAVLASSGRIYAGGNVENAVYGLGVCAERTAAYTAASAGEREILAVAVITPTAASPCGACRQVLAEFAPSKGATPHSPDEMTVIVVGASGHETLHLSDLLPHAFLPGELSSK
jgi:cytidine deaminase